MSFWGTGGTGGMYRFADYSPQWVSSPRSTDRAEAEREVKPLYTAPVGVDYFVSGHRVGSPLPSPCGRGLLYVEDGCLFLLWLNEDETEDVSLSSPAVQLTDKAAHPLSSGTEYGAATFCWEHDSSAAIFVSDRSVFRLDVNDGLSPSLLYPREEGIKMYAPARLAIPEGPTVMAMCAESDDRVGLRVMVHHNDGHVSHLRLPEKQTFLYDPTFGEHGAADRCYLACNAWSVPNMRWTGSMIVLYELLVTNPPLVHSQVVVAGDDEGVATCQPCFSPDGEFLSYLSDEGEGWLQLWVYHIKSGSKSQLTCHPSDACKIYWTTGNANYCWVSDTGIVATRMVDATHQLLFIQLQRTVEGTLETHSVHVLRSGGLFEHVRTVGRNSFSFVESMFNTPPRIIVGNVRGVTPILKPKLLDEDEDKRIGMSSVTIARSGLNLPEGSAMKQMFTSPLHVSFETPCTPRDFTVGATWDKEAGGTSALAHGLLYYRLSADQVETDVASIQAHFCGAAAGQPRPPMLVWMHGGPTSVSHNTWSPFIQYFVSRGWAVLAVNYRGSQGYGRTYRKLLDECWGVVDTLDSISAAKYLWGLFGWLDTSLARNRTAVMGGSAGGFATLNSLIRGPGTFGAGVCLCGVTNLHALDAGTHLLERHYNQCLIGTLPSVEQRYHDRAPINGAQHLAAPLLMIQGGKDTVVPRDQTLTFIEKAPADLVRLIEYPEEGHMLRTSSTVRSMLPSIEVFLADTLLAS